MKIDQILLLPEYEDKLLAKHQVTPDEVEDVVLDRPHIRFIERGSRADEDMYAAYGQTRAGRYLVVFFILKLSRVALVVSARDMDEAERKRYGRRK
jgi:uncharacterized DUF497 family protein